MNQRPRLITELFKGKQSFRELLSQSREQERLLQQIRLLIPAPLNAHCTAAIKKQTQLVIYVDSSTWASRLRFLARELTRQLKSHNLAVDRITVRVLINAKPVVTKRGPIRKLTPENASIINQTADGISDPLLRAALKRLGKHGGKNKS
ncbi:MAG: DUF721 domain-containing protein [Sedimenticola sp.]|uniref:DUF721 domain-containing protein n=1 Tax=Sedimenticola thiotaurini TaxID=1543721 RepID=A0A558DBY4_9GAMM|nr:DUF721 domain-containing protein [Sedimenticola sp.]TVT58542.1 MAG: DUF721 domain-containing protein [Sedimenticola thiotaurini]MCW8882753.1 DUF721 domain-containing protein [Sedimenticola sp.]MCW8921677.1 DUF721 domain-containing protein [Sedimenticola sp.]MCW8947581.1 DUF721 domain-containing protein [Sedimenticola sp.]